MCLVTSSITWLYCVPTQNTQCIFLSMMLSPTDSHITLKNYKCTIWARPIYSLMIIKQICNKICTALDCVISTKHDLKIFLRTHSFSTTHIYDKQQRQSHGKIWESAGGRAGRVASNSRSFNGGGFSYLNRRALRGAEASLLYWPTKLR